MTTTTNLGLTLPTPNVDTGWGGTLNTDFTLIDDVFAASGAGTSVGLNVGSGKTINVGGTLVGGGTVILGSGDATATTTAPTIRGAARTGSNAAGGNLTIDAMNGTGTGGSGKIILRTAPVAASSSTANTMASVFEVNNAGAIGVAGASYGTAKQVLISAGSAAAAAWGAVDGTVINITSQAQGDIIYRGASSWDRLAAGTAGMVLKTAGAAANPYWEALITQATVQNIASGGNGFTGIPSTVKQITVCIRNLTSANPAYIRLGTSSGYVSSGYQSTASWFYADSGGGGQGDSDSATAGFFIYIRGSSYPVNGVVRLTSVGGNVWMCDHTLAATTSSATPITLTGAGAIALAGTLDRVQLVPSSGSFTATGTVSVNYL
jgi:hypothetical protein